MYHTQKTDSQLEYLLQRYRANPMPIDVNFRELVPWLGGPDRATHLIHPYPAKLLAHIPYFFLENSILSRPGDTVFDPFCGSGTVLLEAMLHGRSAVGCDVNPLACLITQVKTSPIDAIVLQKTLEELMDEVPDEPTSDGPDVVNIDYWFLPKIKQRLQCLVEAVDAISSPSLQRFFRVCLSNCARKLSLADPRVSVPVRLKADNYQIGSHHKAKAESRLAWLEQVDVDRVFQDIVCANISRMGKLLDQLGGSSQPASVSLCDARDITVQWPNYDATSNSQSGVQLVITSPPYAGAQKYIRASSLGLGWSRLCSSTELSSLEKSTIGREHYHKAEYVSRSLVGDPEADRLIDEIHHENALRAHIACDYLIQMKRVIIQINSILQDGGYAVLVVGNSHVCGREFHISKFLKRMFIETGMILILELVDDIRSRGLMTKRNRTADIITRESVLVLQKRKDYARIQ